MNKKLFLSLSLLTAAYSFAENNEQPVQVEQSVVEQTIASVEQPVVEQPVKVGFFTKMYNALNQVDKVPVSVKNGFASTCNYVANKAESLKANTWDRSMTIRGTEYKDAGKTAVIATLFASAIATKIAYDKGLFGKMKSKMKSMFTRKPKTDKDSDKAKTSGLEKTAESKSTLPQAKAAAQAPVQAKVAAQVKPAAKTNNGQARGAARAQQMKRCGTRCGR